VGNHPSAKAVSAAEGGDVNNNALDVAALEQDAKRGEVMLQMVFDFLGRFIAFPTEHAQVATTLWAAHAHSMEKWDSTPRLALLSPEPASGKTRALEILELLVPRPVLATDVSSAFLFRRVASEDGRPTILFDEIDAVFGNKAQEKEDLRSFLNAGHRKGAVAGRCVVKGKTVETEELPAYCAVALAGLGWLPDTILTRSVVVRMRRRRADEHVEAYRRRIHAPQGEAIRHELEVWGQSLPDEIERWPEVEGIEDRDADVWEALLVVAELVGGAWPDRARKAAVALVAASKEVEPSLGIKLLMDLRTVFGDRDQMSSKVILQELAALEESPWRDIRGKPLDERGLAYRLRQFSIRSKTVRVGEATPKGYTKADLYDAWRRYLPSPPPQKPATNATNVLSLNLQPLSVADDPPHVADVADTASLAPRKNANGFNVVPAVADVAPPTGDGQLKCAQCNSETGRLENFDGVHLHKECRPFWFGER
jgi:hypothetical protein